MAKPTTWEAERKKILSRAMAQHEAMQKRIDDQKEIITRQMAEVSWLRDKVDDATSLEFSALCASGFFG